MSVANIDVVSHSTTKKEEIDNSSRKNIDWPINESADTGQKVK